MQTFHIVAVVSPNIIIKMKTKAVNIYTIEKRRVTAEETQLNCEKTSFSCEKCGRVVGSYFLTFLTFCQGPILYNRSTVNYIFRNSPKLSFVEWNKYLDEIAKAKSVDVNSIKTKLVDCGKPGLSGATVR